MRESEKTVEEWLFTFSEGVKPSGKSAEFVRVTDGDVKEIWYAGCQHFGSGGGYAGAIYAGIKPEKVAKGRSLDNGFFAEDSAVFRFRAPSILYEYSGDGINDGRVFRNNVFICATDEQIEEARQKMILLLGKEVLKADETALMDYLVEEWKDNDPFDEAHRLEKLIGMDEGRKEEILRSLPSSEISLAARKVSSWPMDQRRAFLSATRKTFEDKKKEEGRAFAMSQIEKIIEMGFSKKRAYAIMKAAGPVRAVEAAQWAMYAYGVVSSLDALDCLLGNPSGTNGFGWGRAEAVLKAFGLNPPDVKSSGAFFRIIAGAHAAILGGIPPK
ncbi:MAG: hypothetical protein PHY30_02900 [Candidatus Pacebacteria bacterium]|nr:hypothetical protein [Candidatus Paceibacterota bacterium]